MDPKTGEVQPVAAPPVDVQLQVFGAPFARGAHRSAHWALIDNAPHVAKRYLGVGSPEDTQTLEEVSICVILMLLERQLKQIRQTSCMRQRSLSIEL